MTSPKLGPPAPRPCKSCPYRRDVPSGIWSAEEYAKLPGYDGATAYQSQLVFQCHQSDRYDPQARLCAGWVGCHDGLLALRVGVAIGSISTETYEAACDYVSPVPLFSSGAEAAEHGVAEIDCPSEAARQLMVDIARRREGVS